MNYENVSMKGVWKFTIKDAVTGKVKRTYTYENLIPTVGREQIAKALAGDTATSAEIEINKTSLGTDVASPNNADTQLGTEVFRKDVASSTFAANQLFITAFYTAPEVSGTFREAGLHINGTGVVNSGILFSHVNINITKSITETLTVDYTVTIT